MPTLRPKEPTGALDLETDEHGHFWISLQNQGGIAGRQVIQKRIFFLQAIDNKRNTNHKQETFDNVIFHHVKYYILVGEKVDGRING